MGTSFLLQMMWLFLMRQGALCNDEEYLTATGCPKRNDTSSSRIFTRIALMPKYRRWPDLLEFMVKRKDVIIFNYSPSTKKEQMENVRFRISKPTDTGFFIETLFSYDDSGMDFMYGWRDNVLSPFMVLCSIFVNEDLTPVAWLQRRAPPEIGFRDKKFYMEGEKIIVSCTVPKLISGSFWVVFPPFTNETLEEETFILKSYSMILIPKIKGGNISCHVPKGVSTWTTDFLRFIDKPYVEPEMDRTNIAITIAFFSCLLLMALFIFGGYTLIVKQRKENTKNLIEKHRESAQNRINTRMSMHRKSLRMSITQHMSDISEDD